MAAYRFPDVPDVDEVEVPRRHRVWRAALWELSVQVVLALILLFFVRNRAVQPSMRIFWSAVLACVPALLWVVLTWQAQRRTLEPRPYLFRVFLLSALLANAVTAPLIEALIEPGRWLNSASLLTRLFGFSLTVGLMLEFTKFIVLRVLVWPSHYRIRMDAIAYGLASGLGVALVLNLRYALVEGGGQLHVAMIHIMSQTLVQQAIGLVTSLGLMNQLPERAGALVLPSHVLGAAMLQGLYAVIRTGIVVRGFGLGATANSPLLALVFGAVFPLIVYGVVAFLVVNADMREQQRIQGPGTIGLEDAG
ncbi:MAG: hypothetical protein Kow0077_18600 [Anaerolineae bacterium]